MNRSVANCDISQRDTLLHAGVDKAGVLISTIPDSLLKGTSNERLVRLLRDPRGAVGDKAVALVGVAYVLSPLDLMPVWLFGPLGALVRRLLVAPDLERIFDHRASRAAELLGGGQGR